MLLRVLIFSIFFLFQFFFHEIPQKTLSKINLFLLQNSHYSSYFPPQNHDIFSSFLPSSHLLPALKYELFLSTNFLMYHIKILNYFPSHLLNHPIFYLNPILSHFSTFPNHLSTNPFPPINPFLFSIILYHSTYSKISSNPDSNH
jgi:hypothetical protein